MKKTNPVILIEFNELCPALLDKWIAEGALPNFAEFRAKSATFLTESDEQKPPYLEPWIQWYSMHTGIPFSEHKVFHLTDGAKAQHTDIWGQLLANGFRVWNCGSMNAKPFTADGSAYMPDPWGNSDTCSPRKLSNFHSLIANYVQEYSRPDAKVDLGLFWRFATYMLGNGLSLGTVKAGVKQILSEKTSQHNISWKRVAIQDALQMDVFESQFNKLSPDFSTFFVNSTAHLQHSYWRCMEPNKFSVQPSQAELDNFGEAIKFGYQQMDKLLARFFQIEQRTGARLILTTALSQQPYLRKEAMGGQHFYRPHSIERLLGSLKIACPSVEAVMTHQYMLRFESEAEAKAAQATLESLKLSNGLSVFSFEHAESNAVFFGCQIGTKMEGGEAVSVAEEITVSPLKFEDIFYQVPGLKSGSHHPDGVLWIKNGKNSGTKIQESPRVSLLDVYPTVLSLFGVGATKANDAGRPGKNILV